MTTKDASNEISSNVSSALQIGDYCSIVQNPKDNEVVSAFISKHCRKYKLPQFLLDLHNEFVLFYGDCFLELPETEQSSPFAMLFAVFRMKIPLQIKGWYLYDPNKQCEYLSAHKRYNIMKQYNFENVPNNIVFHMKHMIQCYDNYILDSKPINEWNQCDIMLSIISYFVKTTKPAQESVWSFIDQFRRFLYDNQFDGYMLLEYMVDYKNNYSQVIKDVCRNSKLSDSHCNKLTNLFKQWCEDICQIDITNNIPHNSDDSHKLLYSVMTTTQQFIYDEKVTSVCSNNLLIHGYIRNHICIYIPQDVQEIIEQFYGKTYRIFYPPPKHNEFDYAVEILLPMKTIGIYRNDNVVDECHGKFALKNIIPTSIIIQVNNTVIDEEKVGEELSVILAPVKQNGNSFIVFRAEKKLNETGTHFMFDITLKKQYKATKRFEFHKFEPDKVLAVFKCLFKNNHIEILHLYGNKRCLTGGTGVTVLVFVDEYIEWSKYKLFKINNLIQKRMGNEFDVGMSYTMKGLKGYGINSSWSNIPFEYWSNSPSQQVIPMSELIYNVKGKDDEKNAWYYVFVDVDKRDAFLDALKHDIIHLEDHGYILFSGYGNSPPQTITDKLKRIWKID